MLKWFVTPVLVLLSIIGVLVWHFNSRSFLTSTTVQGSVLNATQSAGVQLGNTQNLNVTQVKELFQKRGCVNCHDSKNTLLGPSFNAIADRYKTDADARVNLLKSVRVGSVDKWGTGYTMPNHTEQSLSTSEATIMIDWILEVAKASD